jgi:hypothetical protein
MPGFGRGRFGKGPYGRGESAGPTSTPADLEASFNQALAADLEAPHRIALAADLEAGYDQALAQDLADTYDIVQSVETAWTSDVTSGRAPLTVHFTDLSRYRPTAWTWLYGLYNHAARQWEWTQFSTDPNPTLVLPGAGEYGIYLFARNAHGGSVVQHIPYLKVTLPADLAAPYSQVLAAELAATADLIVAQDLAGTYDLGISTSVELEARYYLEGPHIGDLEAAYDLALAADLEGLEDLVVAQDLAAVYHVQEPLAADLEGDYSIGTVVPSDLLSLYNHTLQGEGALLSRYSITRARDLQGRYTVRIGSDLVGNQRYRTYSELRG